MGRAGWGQHCDLRDAGVKMLRCDQRKMEQGGWAEENWVAKLKGGARSHVPTRGPEVKCVRISVSSDRKGEKTCKGRKLPHFPRGNQMPIFP